MKEKSKSQKGNNPRVVDARGPWGPVCQQGWEQTQRKAEKTVHFLISFNTLLPKMFQKVVGF